MIYLFADDIIRWIPYIVDILIAHTAVDIRHIKNPVGVKIAAVLASQHLLSR